MAVHPASPRSSVVSGAPIDVLHLSDDGSFPNNPALPVLHYRGAFRRSKRSDPATVIERVFAMNGWSRAWQDGVYGYHHYHSTAHEVLGCLAGHAQLQVGGPSGPVLELTAFDVLVLPAGAAHKNLEASDDFCVVGAYAGGRSYDMRYGHGDERPEADERIAQVPLPEADPVYGPDGPLLAHWRADGDPRRTTTRSSPRLKKKP